MGCLYVCVLFFNAVTDMICTQQAQKAAIFQQHPSPAMLGQLCSLILQPLALGCTIVQQDLPPSFDGALPVHLLILTRSINPSLLCFSLKLQHHWLRNLLANFPLPAKWSHPVGKRGAGWVVRVACPVILPHVKSVYKGYTANSIGLDFYFERS